MDTIHILILGDSPEAFDILTKLSDSRHKVFMNQFPQNLTIDLLLIIDTFDESYKKSINDKTICFCFNPSITLNIPDFYLCHFNEPENGLMNKHNLFTIDTEIHSANYKFSQVYGILASSGFEINFNESTSPIFGPMLAASSIQREMGKGSQEEIVINDPSKTLFHLIIALDCTGSMSNAIRGIQMSLVKIVSCIKDEFKNLIISFYGFRDYCDKKIIDKITFQDNCKNVTDMISDERASGGGDEPEAHKTCLAEIKNDIDKYQKEMTNVCLFITDAPPHLQSISRTYDRECRSLNEKHLSFACNWLDLANTLCDDGIQVFSFLTHNGRPAVNTMTIMSSMTHGLSFLIPNDSSLFEKQIISIVSNLINNAEATSVQGITMFSLQDEDNNNLTKETSILDLKVNSITDVEEIKNSLLEKGSLMRLKPSDRGAKRVVISASELLDTGIVAIKGLKAFYNIVKGDKSYYSFFEERKEFTVVVKQLKEANPTPDWLAKSSLSCICSMMTIVDSFESLMEIDENDPKVAKDITKIVETLGNFVIGYPFLFQLNGAGKFNMQDAWPILFKDASTAYTMSITSLFHLLTRETKTDEKCTMISKFKDFVASNERSGIVPICCDELTKFVFKILDVTKWLDALVSYGLHRHIEPLPSITRATCCAFIFTISKIAFQSKNSVLSSGQKEALGFVKQALDSLISVGCTSIVKEFTDRIKNEEIPFSAFSPQDPYNCSGINKILNCFFQVQKSIISSNHEFIQKFFNQGIHELIALLIQQFANEKRRSALINSIFEEVKVDVNNVIEQNPLELSDPSALKNFVYHEIEPKPFCKLAIFVFRIIWNMIRDDEFEEPSQLMLTASVAEAIATQSRAFKYQKIENTSEEESKDDEKDKYEIKPIFATQDPIEILRVSSFIFFKRTKAEAILTLQSNRSNYLLHEAINKILSPFRNCDIEDFFSNLLEGFALDWMSEPFKLQMKDSQDIITSIIKNVKRIEPNSKDFYEKAFYILSLGKDKNGHNWEVGSCRNMELIQVYLDQFLDGDKAICNFYKNNCSRPHPNRHAHHAVFCPCQETYSEKYARSRIICSIAPFYFIPDLPHNVKSLDKVIILHLSHKKGAPPLEQIFELAENVKNEMLKFEKK